MTQQQTERDEALIADKKRLADELERMYNGAWADDAVTLRHAAALLRGDEPAKPDRYVIAAREMFAGQEIKNSPTADEFRAGIHDNLPSLQAAAAVLRRHFEPPSEVVEAAEMVQRLSEGATAGTYYASAKAIADFILKGGA